MDAQFRAKSDSEVMSNTGNQPYIVTVMVQIPTSFTTQLVLSSPTKLMMADANQRSF